MAELTDLKSLKPEWALVLAGDKWTVSKLATADIKQLTPCAGIGDVTAQRIIGEARQLVNWEGLKASEHNAAPGSRRYPVEVPRYSVRVKRIMEMRERGEL